jgi:hypothetical protein
VLQVTCCKNFDNAREFLCLGCVQAKQDGRGNASTQDTGVKHPFKMQIISEFCCTNRFSDRIRTSEGLANVSEVLLSKRNLAKSDVILLAHGFGSGLDSVQDGFIAAASADNIIHFLTDFVQAWVGVAMQEGVSSHQLTGCAETALDGTMADKSFLERVERFEVFALVLLVVRAQSSQTLNRQDRFSINFGSLGDAGAGGDAVHQHSADIAAPFATADFCTGEV